MSWVIDPSSGDYVMTNGSPVESTDLKYNAYYRLKIRRQQWMYAPNSKYGCDYYKVTKNLTTKPQTALEAIASRAVQPIVDDGRAQQINVTVTGVSRSGVTVETDITTNNQKQSSITLTGLGVT